MKKSFLVAEVAQAHEGSVNLAISFIDLVKKAGYDAIKFQIHLSEFETTYNDKFRQELKILIQVDLNIGEKWNYL